MLTPRWFAYVLLLATAFTIGLIGTLSAASALAPAFTSEPTLTTPTSTTHTSTAELVEC